MEEVLLMYDNAQPFSTLGGPCWRQFSDFIEAMRPAEWWELTLWERLLWVLREANGFARDHGDDELGWVELNDLCRLHFHTPAQRKADLIEKGHDVRCENRPSSYDGRTVSKYRLFEDAAPVGMADVFPDPNPEEDQPDASQS